MTDQELKELVASLAIAQRETDRLFKETDHQINELRLSQKETSQQIKELGKQTKELGKQIGGLGEKFGSFTEGMALPSMEKTLREKFGMEWVSPRARYRKGGDSIEIDVLAYTNGAVNAAYLIEVKSHAREGAISQLRVMLERFREFCPEHGGKRLYGILAAVDFDDGVREQALRAGFHVARIRDDVFVLDTPERFQPRAY